MFDKAIAFVLKWEGGYVNHPDDPGGETNHGISKRAHPDLDIKNLSLEDAKEIYRRDYWLKSGADTLPWPLALIHFDTAVNMGVHRAQGFLKETRDPMLYVSLRIRHYTRLRSGFPKFGRGWMRRVADLMFEASKEIET